MLYEIFLAFVQAATEFLPISSSGHLALISNLISEPSLFLISILHLASLLAVLIFLRKEIFLLLSFDKKYRKMWAFLAIGTLPAALFGLFFHNTIERSFSSFFFIGLGFLLTGILLFLTKFSYTFSELNFRSSFLIGLIQILSLFPGVSRSGITISSGLFLGLKREEAFKFSFLLFIPLVIGANLLEFGEAFFSFSLFLSFVLCFIFSLFFLNLLYYVMRKGKFWIFCFYAFFIWLISLILGFVR